MNENIKHEDRRIKSGIHFMLGNYAVVEGALAAGCNYFAGYPITPANEISELMSKRLPEVGGIFVQGEDELFSIYSIIGASLAGAKVMTATASAGFNYMQEGIGYASAVEAPCVIVDVQRCRGENFATQADVMQMRWGASGDYESIVLAPSSAQELFDFTIEKESIEIYKRMYTSLTPEKYLPFKAKSNSPPEFAPIGKGYHILYTLNYHNEDGTIDWDTQGYKKLYKRITGKISENKDRICKTESYFLDDADAVIITYGSEVRPALDAIEMFRNDGIKIGMLKLITVWPIHENLIKEIAKNVRRIFAVEMNIGKYAKEIERICLPFCSVTHITKNEGTIHTKEEIYKAIKEDLL